MAKDGEVAKPGSGGPFEARTRPPSMADVAEMAGVSSQTVSRVANNRSNVDEATRERVLAAMQMLGYRPNTAARALATGKFRMLGVISFGLNAYGNARTLEAIVAAAQDAEYSVNVVSVRAQTESAVRDAFDRLTMQAVDGIILIEAQILDTPALRLPSGLPVVVVDGEESRRHPGVDTNQAEGARLATTHLLDLGHRTVWHVCGPQDSYAARRRAESWHRTLKAAGAPVPPLLYGDWSAASGYAAGLELAANSEVSAIFAGNDQMALGVVRALHEAGRSVPDEVSVVGFDDLAESAWFLPSLTTIHQDFEEVGRQCVALLLDQFRSGHGTVHGATPVAPTLIVRDSTSAPPAP